MQRFLLQLPRSSPHRTNNFLVWALETKDRSSAQGVEMLAHSQPMLLKFDRECNALEQSGPLGPNVKSKFGCDKVVVRVDVWAVNYNIMDLVGC